MPTPSKPKAPVRWYDLKVTAEGDGPVIHDLFIYGNIGDKWDEDGVIASSLVSELNGLVSDQINLRINSYGGSVPDGLAIYNALRRHPATVNTFIDGVAISCASYIAMAGDSITMAENSQMMIHAPWVTYMSGNAKDLREHADVLDRFAKGMASAYADKSGMDYDAALALLTDGKDHWYLADEAVAMGLADSVSSASPVAASLAASFDLSRFHPAEPAPQNSATPVSIPVAAATSTKEALMPKPVDPAAPTAASVTEPSARTKSDNQTVLAMFRPFASHPGIAELQTEVLSDPEMSMASIQSALLAKISEGATPANPPASTPRIATVEDESDKRMSAQVTSLLSRAGVPLSQEVRSSLSANPFRGLKLLDMARASLQRANIRTDGKSQMEIVASAFTQSTSDFPVLLENTMHKALQTAYATAALTWNRFCATGTVSDFRAHNRYRLGSFGSLDGLNELGEFTNKTIPDGEKGSITASTKGNVINLSRQAIINDDLGAFVGLASMLGRAAGRTVEHDVYALLALNGGLGPTMPDGVTLFHADHGNLTTSAALTMAALDLDRVAMASQMDVSGEDFLDLRPAVLLLPIGLGGSARAINSAQYDPDTPNKMQKPNVVNGLFRDIVDTPRITGTRRYLFADPSEAPVLEVAFLDGNQEPYLELQNGFDVDGSRWKVRLDYGVAATDFRGALTNAGA